MSRALYPLVLSLFCVAATAADNGAERFTATNGKDSGRVHVVTEHDGLVLRIAGFLHHPFVIETPEDIKEVAGSGLVGGKEVREGVAGGWEVTRSGPRLYVRPLAGAVATTMLVTTQSGKVYVVDLMAPAIGAKGLDRRVSRVVIKGADDAPLAPGALAQLLAARTAAKPAEKEPVAERAPERDEAQASLRNDNYSYELVSGAADEITPTEVFDDGRFTWLRFPGHRSIPAIYKSNPGAKEEWLVNSHMAGDYLVLHGVAKLWVLRLEDRTVGVWNDAFDPYGIASPSGTSAPGIVRVRRP